MINLAGRDILHSAGKFGLTGIGLGLLIGVTLTEKIIPTFKRIYHIRDGRTDEEGGQGLG